MYISVRFRTIISIVLVIVLAACLYTIFLPKNVDAPVSKQLMAEVDSPQKYIKWVDFQVPYNAMNTALNLDIKSQTTPVKLHWVELLSYLAAKYGEALLQNRVQSSGSHSSAKCRRACTRPGLRSS